MSPAGGSPSYLRMVGVGSPATGLPVFRFRVWLRINQIVDGGLRISPRGAASWLLLHQDRTLLDGTTPRAWSDAILMALPFSERTNPACGLPDLAGITLPEGRSAGGGICGHSVPEDSTRD